MGISVTRPVRRVLALALGASLLAGAAAAPVSATAPPTPTVTTVAWPTNPVSTVNQSMDIEVTVSPIPTSGGTVRLMWDNGGTPVQQSANGVNPATGIAFVRLWTISPLPAGSYDMYATFSESTGFADSTSATHTVQIELAANSVTLQAQANPVLVGANANLTARAAGYTDTLELWDAYAGADPVLVDTQSAQPDGMGGYVAYFQESAPAVGTHIYTSKSSANGSYAAATSDPLSFQVNKIPTDPSWNSSGLVLGGSPFTFIVYINRTGGNGFADGATGTATLKEGATILHSCTVAAGTCEFPLTLAAGLHPLTVEYSGDATYTASTRTEDFFVGTDAVDVSSVRLSYTTFYPYKDGYRDSVQARGTRSESASVSIKVYSPTGKLLKTGSVALGTGAYSWAWYGRNSSGTMYPAGKYKIVQIVKDADGIPAASASFTSYVTLSAKKLVTVSKTLTKDYAHRTWQTTYGVAWEWNLPSAISYKKLVFATYAKSSPNGAFGPQDFSICGDVDLACNSQAATIGSTYKWRSLSASVSRSRSGRFVRLYAIAAPRSALKYGRVIVTYTVLK